MSNDTRPRVLSAWMKLVYGTGGFFKKIIMEQKKIPNGGSRLLIYKHLAEYQNKYTFNWLFKYLNIYLMQP